MKKSVLILGIVLGTVVTMKAQTATPNVVEKQKNQIERIREGVENGKLTPRETANLKKDQRELRRMKKAAKKDSVVTKKERAVLNKKANRNSKKIFKKKHN